jgi:hypothetical protein
VRCQYILPGYHREDRYEGTHTFRIEFWFFRRMLWCWMPGGKLRMTLQAGAKLLETKRGNREGERGEGKREKEKRRERERERERD